MEIWSVLKFELQRNWKSILIFAGVIGGFILLMTGIFDPTLFAAYNDIMAGIPPELLDMIGGLVDMSTFEGFFNLYIFEFAWMWYGLYLILKVAQDIPGEMENKTIDLVLSKPIKRWEFVIGKQLEHIITIVAVIIASAVCTLGAIAFNPNVIAAEVDIGGFLICFVLLGFLLLAIESTVLLISTILGGKKAMAAGFGVVMGLWFISAYGGNFSIANIEYISFFTFFDSRAILIEGVMTGVLGDMLILLGYSVVLSSLAVVYFTKRDIPV
jgi:ABC-2 type transport system permease protein